MLGKCSSDADWDQMGQRDPYFAVCTDERYRTGRLDPAARAHFFRTGEDYVALLFSSIRATLCPDFQPVRALDFGCGVGRLAIPLARECSEVVGVDVSPGMLAEARKNSHELSASNIDFVRSDDCLSQVQGSFDFVHSFIVLQHIPARRGLRLTRALVDLLSDGGIGALHYTYARRASGVRKAVHWLRKNVPGANGLVNVVQGRLFNDAMIQMNAYDLNEICLILQEKGCNNVSLRFTDHGGHLGVAFVFLKQSGRRETRGQAENSVG